MSTGAGSAELSPAQVAGYIAKYATKSAHDPAFGVDTSPHLRRLCGIVAMLADRTAAADLRALDAGGESGSYELLGDHGVSLDEISRLVGHSSTAARNSFTATRFVRCSRWAR
jgi:hypothetical protein